MKYAYLAIENQQWSILAHPLRQPTCFMKRKDTTLGASYGVPPKSNFNEYADTSKRMKQSS
jgi:hypothetical protein